MVLNAAVQMLREAEELKQKILKYKSGTSMLQDRNLWVTQQELQKVYQKVLVLDLDYALDKKVEQDLWNVGFKQQIEALQAVSKDRKNPSRGEGQALLAWVLQAAAGFYLCLLHQICTTFKLDLPFRRRASLLGCVAGWGAAGAGGAAAARYAAQHCLVHLGDLARYRHQMTTAHTFYRHALLVSAHSGQPYNQLALLATRRGRALAALYYHARSLLVRSPFPPARANLARTLRANACDKDLPVLAESSPRASPAPPAPAPPPPADARAHVDQLLRALHLLYTVQETETAEQMVENLNASALTLVAAGAFEPMTLIKMSVVVIWLVHWATDDAAAAADALSAGEAAAARGGLELCAGAELALLLPDDERLLAPLKVWLQWQTSRPTLLAAGALRAPRLWAALARRLNALAARPALDAEPYASMALPEDAELHGFLPLEPALASLDTPCAACAGDGAETAAAAAGAAGGVGAELEGRLRAHRLLQLGRRLAELRPDLLGVSEGDVPHFSAVQPEGEAQLAATLDSLTAPAPAPAPAPPAAAAPRAAPAAGTSPPPPPLVISEADFREKVREKRVGILKPQGSLERSREERAAVTTLDEQECEAAEEAPRGEDARREARRPRTNVAMAAILRKQEEGNKQVKFVTPPPTPDAAAAEPAPDKKLLQPKPRLGQPGRTGGILALKDKSGYPHLVNAGAEPAPPERPPPAAPAADSGPWRAPAARDDPPRFAHKGQYGPHHAGAGYGGPGPGLRLPVVNPKEIDVRSAALQRARPDPYPDKFAHMSGDKKNFLNDLPPRFANQFRHWQGAQDLQYTPDNKFRDDNFKSNAFSAPPPPPPPQPWANPPEYQGWWKPEPGAYAVTPPSYYYQSPYKAELPTFVPSGPPPLAPYGSPLGGFGGYAGPAGPVGQHAPAPPPAQRAPPPPGQGAYDSAMYPQFNKMGYSGFKAPEKAVGQFGDAEGVFSAPPPDPRRAYDQLRGDNHPTFEPMSGRGADAGSTYSLFSGSRPPPWPPAHQQSMQSLWSGPSVLERLLEQQRQNAPPAEPQ